MTDGCWLEKYCGSCTLLPYGKPAFVAQLDARPTGDQDVAGSTHAGSATFFRGD